MIDARYDEARKTDQSGQRGWDFSEEPKSSNPSGWVIVGISFGLIVIGMIAISMVRA